MISIVIPTLNRGPVLLDTIRYLLNLAEPADEIIVVDQTDVYDDSTRQQMQRWNSSGKIKWIRETEPSVVKAMNIGLCRASSEYALFLDDDIKPFDNLIGIYQRAVSEQSYKLIAGRVVQPWDDPSGINLKESDEFSFNSLDNADIDRFMGGNFLLHRKTGLAFGGFDEHFKGSAHDYEREFSDRLNNADIKFFYCAAAGIHHLKESTGGIRSHGHFLKTIKPHHALGAYYYVLRSKLVTNKLSSIWRCFRERVFTRTHLREPWWILPSIAGNLVALSWAVWLRTKEPKLIPKDKPR